MERYSLLCWDTHKVCSQMDSSLRSFPSLKISNVSWGSVADALDLCNQTPSILVRVSKEVTSLEPWLGWELLEKTHKAAERHSQHRCMWDWNLSHAINTQIVGGFSRPPLSKNKDSCGCRSLMHAFPVAGHFTTSQLLYPINTAAKVSLLPAPPARQRGCIAVASPRAGMPLPYQRIQNLPLPKAERPLICSGSSGRDCWHAELILMKPM